jgi:hypothetical protein
MNTGDLIDAVRSHRAVEILYIGRAGASLRILHPHVVYRTSDGKLCMEGVQVGGHSQSGSLPGWRDFELMKVSDLRVLDSTFTVDEQFDPAADKYRHGLLASA